MSISIGELLHVLADGAEGYATAAKSVKDMDLKILFEGFSAERHEMARELAAFAKADPDGEKSSGVGSLHRGWITLKGAITAGDDYAILAECERGEDHAIEVFNKAIDEPPAADVASVIGSLSIRILAVHHQIKRLRDEAKEFERPRDA